MIAGAVAPAFLILVTVVGYALYQLHALSGDFNGFVSNDLSRLEAYNAMYAQGTNSGQAIRSVMLNPADQANKATLLEAGGNAITEGEQVLESVGQTRAAAINSGNGVAGIAPSVEEHMQGIQSIVPNMEGIADKAQENLQSVSNTTNAVHKIRELADQTLLTFAKFQT